MGYGRTPSNDDYTPSTKLIIYCSGKQKVMDFMGMPLFKLNTGVSDQVGCNLNWEWEMNLEEINCILFMVPPRSVKGRKCWRPLVCNHVTQSIIEEQRGELAEFVFPYQRSAFHDAYPVETVNNSGLQNAREAVA
jgi:hypothetical protein